MTLLEGQRVVAVEDAAEGALARLLVELGATLARVPLSGVNEAAARADFLLERLGLPALADAGIAAEQLAARQPALIHVSVTCFGSAGPRARWRGSELVASAMGGAVTLHDEREWSRLQASEGIAAAASADERDAALAQWARERTDHDAAERLQALGIAAGAVQDVRDLLERDPGIAARGALVQLDHSVLGAFGHVRTPVTFSRSTLAPLRAPSLGEHGREIAATVCGLSPARIAELESMGVFR